MDLSWLGFTDSSNGNREISANQPLTCLINFDESSIVERSPPANTKTSHEPSTAANLMDFSISLMNISSESSDCPDNASMVDVNSFKNESVTESNSAIIKDVIDGCVEQVECKDSEEKENVRPPRQSMDGNRSHKNLKFDLFNAKTSEEEQANIPDKPENVVLKEIECHVGSFIDFTLSDSEMEICKTEMLSEFRPSMNVSKPENVDKNTCTDTKRQSSINNTLSQSVYDSIGLMIQTPEHENTNEETFTVGDRLDLLQTKINYENLIVELEEKLEKQDKELAQFRSEQQVVREEMSKLKIEYEEKIIQLNNDVSSSQTKLTQQKILYDKSVVEYEKKLEQTRQQNLNFAQLTGQLEKDRVEMEHKLFESDETNILLESKIELLENKCSKLIEDKMALENDIGLRNSELQAKLVSLEQLLESNKKESNEKIDLLEQSNQKTKAQLEETQAELDDLKQIHNSCDQVAKMNEKLSQDLDSVRQERSKLLEQIAESKSQWECMKHSLLDESDSLRKTIAEMNQKLENANELVQQLTDKNAELENALKLGQTNSASKIEELKQKLVEMEKSRTDLQDKLKQDCYELTQQVQSWKDAAERSENELKQARSLLEQRSNKLLTQIEATKNCSLQLKQFKGKCFVAERWIKAAKDAFTSQMNAANEMISEIERLISKVDGNKKDSIKNEKVKEMLKRINLRLTLLAKDVQPVLVTDFLELGQEQTVPRGATIKSRALKEIHPEAMAVPSSSSNANAKENLPSIHKNI